MRFPDIPFMKPVFQLIRDNPNSPIANKLKLLPYYLSDPSGNDLNFYNGIILTNSQVKSDPSPDPFRTGINPPAKYDQMVTNAIGKFKDALKANFVTGWTELMKYDGWSTRDYAALSPQGPKYKDSASRVHHNISMIVLTPTHSGLTLWRRSTRQPIYMTVLSLKASWTPWISITQTVWSGGVSSEYSFYLFSHDS